MVDEGAKVVEEIATDILRSFDCRTWRQEAVSTVFIYHTDVPSFQQAFAAVSKESTGPTWKDKTAQAALSSFSASSVHTELKKLLRHETPGFGVQQAIEAARQADVLLVLSFKSLDQVIEALNILKPSPKYLTLLSPSSKANSDYFRHWTTSDFLSLGRIESFYPYGKPVLRLNELKQTLTKRTVQPSSQMLSVSAVNPYCPPLSS